MKFWILVVFCVLSVIPQARAEMDGRFLYVSQSKGKTDYIFSDGAGREADIKTNDIDAIVKAIGRLGSTGSLNYIAIRLDGQVKITSILPLLKAIENNANWELAVLQRGGGIGAGIALHHLDRNDPHRKKAQEHGEPEKKGK